jgi:hypothetical protein
MGNAMNVGNSGIEGEGAGFWEEWAVAVGASVGVVVCIGVAIGGLVGEAVVAGICVGADVGSKMGKLL